MGRQTGSCALIRLFRSAVSGGVASYSIAARVRGPVLIPWRVGLRRYDVVAGSSEVGTEGPRPPRVPSSGSRGLWFLRQVVGDRARAVRLRFNSAALSPAHTLVGGWVGGAGGGMFLSRRSRSWPRARVSGLADTPRTALCGGFLGHPAPRWHEAIAEVAGRIQGGAVICVPPRRGLVDPGDRRAQAAGTIA